MDNDESFDFCCDWALCNSINNMTGYRIPSGYICIEEKWVKPFLNLYLQLTRYFINIFDMRETDTVASGSGFFYFCLLYVSQFEEWMDYFYELFLYNLLYLLVDHYIDNTKISNTDKKQAIAVMYQLLEDPTIETDNYNLKLIGIVYNILITPKNLEEADRCKTLKEAIKLLFQAEVDGLVIQSSPPGTFTEQEYHEIAGRKGGETIRVLHAILGRSLIGDGWWNLGVTLQLIDDMLDIETDTEDNIYTIARYHLDRYGNTNKLYNEIIERTSRLPKEVNIFKFMYINMLIYYADRYDHLSVELRNRMNSLNCIVPFKANIILTEMAKRQMVEFGS